jgi:hypothetical protein
LVGARAGGFCAFCAYADAATNRDAMKTKIAFTFCLLTDATD